MSSSSIRKAFKYLENLVPDCKDFLYLLLDINKFILSFPIILNQTWAHSVAPLKLAWIVRIALHYSF